MIHLSPLASFAIFVIIFAAASFGIYMVAKKNGDLADAKADVSKLGSSISGSVEAAKADVSAAVSSLPKL